MNPHDLTDPIISKMSPEARRKLGVQSSHDLTTIFPNASADFLARNSGEAPKLERGLGNAPLEKKEVQGSTGPGFLIRVTSIRRRLLDQSNLCYKYHEDLCRYAGILPDDSPGICQSEVTQRKAKKGEAERTLIEVFTLTPTRA